MNEHLLLLPPHRQIVFRPRSGHRTDFPKAPRVLLRRDKGLCGEISKLVYRMIQRFTKAAAGRRVQRAAVIACASAGEFAGFNPHLHGIFLEGGFDREGQFVHVLFVEDLCGTQ